MLAQRERKLARQRDVAGRLGRALLLNPVLVQRAEPIVVGVAPVGERQ